MIEQCVLQTASKMKPDWSRPPTFFANQNAHFKKQLCHEKLHLISDFTRILRISAFFSRNNYKFYLVYVNT